MYSGQRSLLLVFTVCASLCARCPVDGYINGAPPESCDTMRAVHQGSRAFSDCAVPSLCPTITIDGVDIINNVFQYNCNQNYTFTMNSHSSSLRGFMVEFRTSSNSTTFDGSLSHVGEFAIASGYADTTRLECGGHAVTQTKINTDGRTSFVWTSPGVGQQERAQLWYTQVTSSRADFLPRKGVVGVPSEVSCNCPAYTYLVVRQTTPMYQSECVQCPENSTSERGINQMCPCLGGFGRFDVNNASQPCSRCFSTHPTDLTVISSQRPNVIISWNSPANIDGWDVLYRVTVDDGRMNVTAVEGSSLTMLTLPNLMPRANYTLHVFVYTESGCLSSPASVDITVLERCPSTPPSIMNVVHVQGHVGLQYTHPQITDSMISRNDFRYAVYAKCGSDSSFKMIKSGIRNTYYSIADLPEETQCRVKLVAYSNDCPLEIEGKLSVETTFTKPPSGGPTVDSGDPDLTTLLLAVVVPVGGSLIIFLLVFLLIAVVVYWKQRSSHFLKRATGSKLWAQPTSKEKPLDRDERPGSKRKDKKSPSQDKKNAEKNSQSTTYNPFGVGEVERQSVVLESDQPKETTSAPSSVLPTVEDNPEETEEGGVPVMTSFAPLSQSDLEESNKMNYEEGESPAEESPKTSSPV